MINKIRDLSIHSKLLLTVLFPSLISLLFAGVVLIVLETAEFKKVVENDLTTLATVIGNRSAAALAFSDPELAKENLAALHIQPAVETACIYNKQGQIFAQFLKNALNANWVCPPFIEGESSHFDDSLLWVRVPITTKGDVEGSILVYANFAEAYSRKIKFTLVVFSVLAIGSVLAFFLTAPFIKLIALPVKKLVTTVIAISNSKDYSLRAEKLYNDELGVLVDAFNDLIIRVENQNQAITRAKDRYLALYDDNPTMIFNLTENGMIMSANLTGANHLGLSVNALEESSVLDFVHPADISLMRELISQCLTMPLSVHKQELRQVCDNGRIIWVRATARMVAFDGQQNNLLLVCEDVTETHNLSLQIAYQASHDSLTGLANRIEFDKAIKQAITLASSNNSEHALCYLDLDQFKIVNDTSGHLAGDELLRQLGDLLKKQLRRNDFIARLGGDEFGILMYYCSLEEAINTSEKIRNAVTDFHFAWEGRRFSVGVSIGIALIKDTSANAVNLLKEADAACYAAKDKGRNRVHVFRPDDEELALRHGEMQWVQKIHQALEQDLFCLYGQPIAGINKPDTKLHFETLVRYKDAKGSIIPPGAFLPAAERYNLAPAMDRWVIKNLFAWIANTPNFLDQLELCAVNLSGLSLSDESLFNFIIEQFKAWDIPTHKICFEITETAAISNLTSATRFIHQLRDKGCSFSLDDFGSGLSSFAYLKNLPVDFLKIDGLFVKDILDDKIDFAMVKAINEVGQMMGKKTIAEFVENEHIFNLLKELGVDYAQGYGIGKPVPLHDLKLIIPFTRDPQ
ncbi:MAG: EAL domain-containing protein [Methylovulum miyakonense]|uniref:EAL domain-containing protein n=1 Tax=Methylovulum miyakonense TaxID=645578 RepID=UPI003BB4BA0C